MRLIRRLYEAHFPPFDLSWENPLENPLSPEITAKRGIVRLINSSAPVRSLPAKPGILSKPCQGHQAGTRGPFCQPFCQADPLLPGFLKAPACHSVPFPKYPAISLLLTTYSEYGFLLKFRFDEKCHSNAVTAHYPYVHIAASIGISVSLPAYSIRLQGTQKTGIANHAPNAVKGSQRSWLGAFCFVIRILLQQKSADKNKPYSDIYINK